MFPCHHSLSRLLAHTSWNNKAVRPLGGIVNSTLTQTALSETLPDLALVLATSKRLVGIKDSVTGRDKGRVARLEGHAVKPELHGEVLAVGGDALGVEGREVSVVFAVLVDEVPEDFVKHGGPDVADLVDGGGAVAV